MAKNLWFGTEDYMQWVETPLSGAESTPQGWEASGTLLNGGGYASHSWGTHRTYDYTWRNSSAREASQIMQNYRNGTWGRGLIYFHDPLTFDQNILPARWADPSMALGDESMSLVYGQQPVASPTPSFQVNGLPIQSVTYNVNQTTTGINREDSLFIPIPEGYQLRLGAVYTRVGLGGIFATPVQQDGVERSSILLNQVAPDAAVMTPNPVEVGMKGVRLWIGKSGSGTPTPTVTVSAMTARLVKVGSGSVEASRVSSGPWIGGQGHSGCRFDGPPTEIKYNRVNGGQVGYSASFKEVGSWEYV